MKIHEQCSQNDLKAAHHHKEVGFSLQSNIVNTTAQFQSNRAEVKSTYTVLQDEI